MSAPQSQLYRNYIQPDHPLIQALFDEGQMKGADLVLRHGLQIMADRFSYVGYRGPGQFDDILQKVGQASGQVPINCIDSCRILVSFLRANGYSPEDAFLCLAHGAPCGEPGSSIRKDMHAWTLLRHVQPFLWIDPNGLRVHSLSGREILEHHQVFVSFNDQRFAFGSKDIRTLFLQQ